MFERMGGKAKKLTVCRDAALSSPLSTRTLPGMAPLRFERGGLWALRRLTYTWHPHLSRRLLGTPERAVIGKPHCATGNVARSCQQSFRCVFNKLFNGMLRPSLNHRLEVDNIRQSDVRVFGRDFFNLKFRCTTGASLSGLLPTVS
jgi:hypothetical protein